MNRKGRKVGHEVSKETRLKISLSLIGNTRHLGSKHSVETKAKMRLAKLGKKHSKEHNRKISLGLMGNRSRTGEVYSIEARKAQSERFKGAKSHLWRGGITKVNVKIRSSLEYRLWREAVFKRDDWTCVKCKKRGVKLNADHIKQFAFYPKLRFKVNNGRTLCEDCHKKTDTYKNRNKN